MTARQLQKKSLMWSLGTLICGIITAYLVVRGAWLITPYTGIVNESLATCSLEEANQIIAASSKWVFIAMPATLFAAWATKRYDTLAREVSEKQKNRRR